MMTIGKSTFITKTRYEIKEKEERILHGLYKNEKWKELEHRLLRENTTIFGRVHMVDTKKKIPQNNVSNVFRTPNNFLKYLKNTITPFIFKKTFRRVPASLKYSTKENKKMRIECSSCRALARLLLFLYNTKQKTLSFPVITKVQKIWQSSFVNLGKEKK